MARQVSRFEAATEPPTIHASLPDAVTAEMAALMGWKAGGDSGVPGLAKLLVDQAPDVIACLAQLTDPTQQENARV
ncbi:MAG: hypothetical protein A2792_00235 [Sphingomonadales bacterium RIFCSPHIGHO2_01_FULL_65_20]|nr:MAG: hypothetical protein A2792_00235 [Sphingomonadales bacterium RIFCSPHIGHO2_01_FULL_65_20]